MKTLFTKRTVLVAAMAVLLSTDAHANEMVNNNAQGIVGGGIEQYNASFGWGDIVPNIVYNTGSNGSMEVAVGSIKADRAKDNNATGAVSGQITQQASWAWWGSGNAIPAVQVGSISARDAYQNNAQGSVDGDINQMGNVKTEVGSIDAGSDENSLAYQNNASGHVGGSILQWGGVGSPSRISVGSIGPVGP